MLNHELELCLCFDMLLYIFIKHNLADGAAACKSSSEKTKESTLYNEGKEPIPYLRDVYAPSNCNIMGLYSQEKSAEFGQNWKEPLSTTTHQ